MNTKITNFSWLVVSMLLLFGCTKSGDGFDRANASGSVTLDGKPLADGVVYFIPTDGTTGPKSFASVIEGKFVAEGELAPIVGKHRVEIRSNDDGGVAFDDEEAMVKLATDGKRGFHRVVVPPIYNQNSVLTANVTADGPNEFKFELSSKRRR